MFLIKVGLIVYLAHVGCWVPARSATIPLLDNIFTRIQTVESVSIGVSSFLCDVNQVCECSLLISIAKIRLEMINVGN